jgi:hypothetical protein
MLSVRSDNISNPAGATTGHRLRCCAGSLALTSPGISFVMAGFIPAIHVFPAGEARTWMPGTHLREASTGYWSQADEALAEAASPGMTEGAATLFPATQLWFVAIAS